MILDSLLPIATLIRLPRKQDTTTQTTQHRKATNKTVSTSRKISRRPSRRCWQPITTVTQNQEANSWLTVVTTKPKDQAPSMMEVSATRRMTTSRHRCLRLSRSSWRRRTRDTNGWTSCTRRMTILRIIIFKISLKIERRKVISWKLRRKISDNCKNLWQPRDQRIHSKILNHSSKKSISQEVWHTWAQVKTMFCIPVFSTMIGKKSWRTTSICSSHQSYRKRKTQISKTMRHSGLSTNHSSRKCGTKLLQIPLKQMKS